MWRAFGVSLLIENEKANIQKEWKEWNLADKVAVNVYSDVFQLNLCIKNRIFYFVLSGSLFVNLLAL